MMSYSEDDWKTLEEGTDVGWRWSWKSEAFGSKIDDTL